MIKTSFSPSLDSLLRELKHLEDSLQKKAIRSGLVQAVKPIKKTAKQLAPKKAGALAQAVGHRQLSKRAKSRLGIPKDTDAIIVGTNRKINGRWQGKKGIWQEHGTTYMRANSFLSPALEQHESQLDEGFYHGLASFLDKQKK